MSVETGTWRAVDEGVHPIRSAPARTRAWSTGSPIVGRSSAPARSAPLHTTAPEPPDPPDPLDPLEGHP